MGIIDPAHLVRLVDERMNLFLDKVGLALARKAKIDPSFTSGDPKILRPGESGTVGRTRKILIPFSSIAPVASDDIVELPLNGNSSIIVGKIGSPPGTPTIGAGAGAGTGPSVSILGSDTGGKITVTSGTGCTANAVIATITLSTTYGAAPAVTFSAGNGAAASVGSNKVFVGSTTTSSFTLDDTGTALTDSTTYIWYYKAVY